MIKGFAHNGLRQFFEDENKKGIPQEMAKRLRVRLDTLDAANDISEMNIPAWSLHELKGSRKGTWSMTVTGNYRLTFRFHRGDAFEVNLEDYHS